MWWEALPACGAMLASMSLLEISPFVCIFVLYNDMVLIFVVITNFFPGMSLPKLGMSDDERIKWNNITYVITS